VRHVYAGYPKRGTSVNNYQCKNPMISHNLPPRSASSKPRPNNEEGMYVIPGSDRKTGLDSCTSLREKKRKFASWTREQKTGRVTSRGAEAFTGNITDGSATRAFTGRRRYAMIPPDLTQRNYTPRFTRSLATRDC